MLRFCIEAQLVQSGAIGEFYYFEIGSINIFDVDLIKSPRLCKLNEQRNHKGDIN